MLVLTDRATAVIRSLVNGRPGLPADAGLRITGSPDRPAGVAISRAVTARRGDLIVEQHGARVFLDVTAAEVLDDKVMDAEVDADGTVRFVLVTQ